MCVKIPPINNIPVRSRESRTLFRQRTPKAATIVSDHAQYITQNVKFNRLSILLFNMIDGLAPVLSKNTKLAKPLLSFVERVVNFSEHV